MMGKITLFSHMHKNVQRREADGVVLFWMFGYVGCKMYLCLCYEEILCHHTSI